MSLTRHGQEYREQNELERSRHRTEKLNRVELNSGKPKDEIYAKTDYYDRGRYDDVSLYSNSVIDHRPKNQRIRLKKDSSGDSSSDRKPKQKGNSQKISESVQKRSEDTQRGQRRILPSTPTRFINNYTRGGNSVPASISMPVNKPGESKTSYTQNKHERSEIGQRKSNKEKQRVSKPRESKDQNQTVPKNTCRNEEIPLREIRSYTPADSSSPRSLRHQGDVRRRQDGTGATVTFQMQDNDYSTKETSGKRVLSPLCGQHTDIIHDKGDFKREFTIHGSSSVPTEQKHYLSPDGHPSMVERSKTQNRLQNQSSTETSGLGETITSGFSSQESIASHYSSTRVGADTGPNSCYDQGIDLTEDIRSITEDRYSTFESKPIDSDKTSKPVYESYHSKAKSLSPTHVSLLGKGETREIKSSSLDTRSKKRKVSDIAQNSHPMIDGFKRQGAFLGPTEQLNNTRSSKHPTTSQTSSSRPPKTLDLASCNVGPNFDELFMQSESLPVPQTTMGLQVDQIANEWNKHNRSSSIKSRSSHGSFRSRSGSTRRSKRFLAESESRWMKWGRERRASFRRRLEKLEKAEPEIQPRPSTPVKKARQEGLMFIHPDLESKYISEEDINYIQRHRQERLKTYKVIEKAKKIPYQNEHHELNRLTVTELNILTRFWEHRVFVRSRYVSILLSLGTILIYVISICSAQWISYPSGDGEYPFYIKLRRCPGL